jgi:hypothetical protein
MAYADFTLDMVESALGLTIQPGDLFPGIEPSPVPAWMDEALRMGRESAALVSEKARSEFIVVPILLAARHCFEGELAIFSGQRLDVDPSRGLVGECDFLLALAPPIPRLKSPLVTVLEAKKGDIEAGLGQCIAQVAGARIFNERAGDSDAPVFGCVTNGGEWQFFRLDGSEVILDRRRFYLDRPGDILAALVQIFRIGAESKGHRS